MSASPDALPDAGTIGVDVLWQNTVSGSQTYRHLRA